MLQQIEAFATLTAVVAHLEVESTQLMTFVSMLGIGAVETVATQQLHFAVSVVLCPYQLLVWWLTPNAQHVFNHSSMMQFLLNYADLLLSFIGPAHQVRWQGNWPFLTRSVLPGVIGYVKLEEVFIVLD